MKTIKNKTTQETHPLFPSGTWEGFYTYQMGPDAGQHAMAFSLNFKDEIITGNGSDDVGGFSWRGAYSKEGLVCTMTKAYATHTVDYQGNVDENGIWGTWTLDWMKGGFHIWPKANAENEVAKEVKKMEIKG